MAEVSPSDLEGDSDATTLEELSKEELDALQRLGKETISSLEAEINLLERKIKQFGPGALPRKDFESMIGRSDDTSSVEEMENILQKEIDTHSARVKETVRLTGVTIENIEREVLEIDDNHCIKQFALELLFMNRKVHLKYTLEDNLTTVGEQGGKITWFEIKFEEDINKAVGADIAKDKTRGVQYTDGDICKQFKTAAGDFKAFKQWAADNLAIHSVFSILKSFIQWQADRDKMMKHFTEKYPDNVSQLMGKEGNLCLRIGNTKPDHPQFTLEWSRKIVNSRVTADITVDVNAPKDLLELDNKKVLNAIPDMFTTMTKKLGLEKAIDSLIQLVISDGQIILQEESLPVETPPEDAVSMEAPLVEASPGDDALSMEMPLVETSQEDAVLMETPQE